MNTKLYKLIADLKLLIGFLGEKTQHNWWGSNFLGKASGSFLSHPFPRTTLLSQYYGASEAALLIHDERIGLGQNYHLFRLPDSLERKIAHTIQDPNYEIAFMKMLESKDHAEAYLSDMVPNIDAKDGPMDIGLFSDNDLKTLILNAGGCYLTAFRQGKQSFPFMRGADGSS